MFLAPVPAKALGIVVGKAVNGATGMRRVDRNCTKTLVSMAAVLIAGAGAVPATAQTQAQQDRIDRVSRFAVTSPMCRQLGMAVATDLGDKVETAFKAETSTWSIDRAIVERLKQASIDRQVKITKIDLETASENAKTEDELRRLRTVFVTYGRLCVEATNDPIFSRLITAPAGFDPERAATAVADGMLEGGGLASWQTPAIQARGDMMMAAGTCRKRIGKARSDALVAEFGKSDDARAREYYLESFDSGLNDTELDFDLAQCNRLIARTRVKIGKAGLR